MEVGPYGEAPEGFAEDGVRRNRPAAFRVPAETLRPMRPVFLVALALLVAACQDPEPVPSPTPPPDVADVPTAPSPDPAVAESDTLTVVFFGDSLTAGYGLSDDALAYPALVGAKLEAAGLPVRVVNAGNSGETSAGGLSRVAWALRQSRPDVFVLALGANDGLRGIEPDVTRQNLDAILSKVEEAAPDARLVVAGMEALPNYGADYTGRFRAVFPAVAEAHDAVLVPFLLADVAGVRRLNQPDGVHPTAEGQQIVAETVFGVVEPVVREVAG